MKKNPGSNGLMWLRLCFLLSPEDSSAADAGLPPWATPCCLRIKTALWLVVSVAAAAMVGQL